MQPSSQARYLGCTSRRSLADRGELKPELLRQRPGGRVRDDDDVSGTDRILDDVTLAVSPCDRNPGAVEGGLPSAVRAGGFDFGVWLVVPRIPSLGVVLGMVTSAHSVGETTTIQQPFG